MISCADFLHIDPLHSPHSFRSFLYLLTCLVLFPAYIHGIPFFFKILLASSNTLRQQIHLSFTNTETADTAFFHGQQIQFSFTGCNLFILLLTTAHIYNISFRVGNSFVWPSDCCNSFIIKPAFLYAYFHVPVEWDLQSKTLRLLFWGGGGGRGWSQSASSVFLIMCNPIAYGSDCIRWLMCFLLSAPIAAIHLWADTPNLWSNEA